jgi:RNA methyltransferase, TrmH family
MLSKSQISFVNALHQKKARKENGLFIAEGIKSVTEFIQSDYIVDTIFCAPAEVPKMSKLSRKIKLVEVSEAELKKISTLTTPQGALALIQIPPKNPIDISGLRGNFVLVLDGIQDPGNLGTIIRTAEWFGFSTIICSNDTVEAYNPKVVQATMGSLSRMKIHYTDLGDLIDKSDLPVFGALLDGESIYKADFGKEGFIILGNEGNGISEPIKAKVSKAVTIPKFGNAESLNVAISAAIFCSELKRIY